MSVDPLTKSWAELSPYQFAGNTPIGCIDIEGLEPVQKVMSNNLYSPKLEVPGHVSGLYHNSNWYFQRIVSGDYESKPYWVASRLKNWAGDRDYVYYDDNTKEYISYVPEGYTEQEKMFKQNAITLGEFGKRGERVVVATVFLIATQGRGADAALEFMVNGENADIADLAIGMIPGGGRYKLLLESGKTAVSAMLDVSYIEGETKITVIGAEYFGVEGDKIKNKTLGKTGTDLMTDLILAKGFPFMTKANGGVDSSDPAAQLVDQIFNLVEKVTNNTLTDEFYPEKKP